ncbi:MAG: hypothetical protein ACRELC_11315 [Gemmatimonadota bacterium]
MALIRNVFAGIGCLTVLVVLAIAGWLYRDEIREWLERRDEIVMAEPSEELAMRAEEKLEAIGDGTAEGETRFSETELQSYLIYRIQPRLPAGVSNPAVDVRDSTIAVSAALDMRVLAQGSEAAEGLRRFLGDSSQVTSELLPTVEQVGRARLEVLSLQAGVFPVPPLLIGTVLREVGLPNDGGRAIVLLIPDDIRAVRIENDEVILVPDDGSGR